MRYRRRILFVPFGGAAIAMAITAAAFGCTVFKGTLTVAGNNGGSVTTTGLRGGMIESVSAGSTSATATNGSAKVSTGTDGCCNKLPWKDSAGALREYQINFLNGEGYSSHSNWANDCMAGSGGVTLTKVHLSSNGQINEQLVNGSFKKVSQPLNVSLGTGLTKNTAPAESALCISDAGGSYGNQAPIAIV